MTARIAHTDAERRAAIGAMLTTFAKARRLDLADVSEMWRERSAIREYLGGLRHRRNAELHGASDTIEWFSERRRIA